MLHIVQVNFKNDWISTVTYLTYTCTQDNELRKSAIDWIFNVRTHASSVNTPKCTTGNRFVDKNIKNICSKPPKWFYHMYNWSSNAISFCFILVQTPVFSLVPVRLLCFYPAGPAWGYSCGYAIVPTQLTLANLSWNSTERLNRPVWHGNQGGHSINSRNTHT